jgi:glycosyltransferase involved in cell wall biosynthesis
MVAAMRYPHLSIVIPVYDSGRALDRTLRALASTEPGPSMFEVIVADDGSREPLGSVVDAYRQQIPINYVRLAKNSGRATARNAGASRARGRRLLFLDCDSVPLKGLVHGHATFGIDDHERRVLLGSRIDPGWKALEDSAAYSESPSAVAPHEDDLRHVYSFEARAGNITGHRTPYMFCFTHNLSVPRDAFVELGGFDESFVQWGWEDVEFGYRFFLSWHRTGGFDYRPDIICMHLPHFHGARLTEIISTPNVRYLKKKHPYFDLELLGTAPDARVESKVRYYEGILAKIRLAGLGLSAADVTRLLPETGQQNALWIGAGLGIDGEDRWQLDHGRDAQARNLHLLGVDTPFDEGAFDTVVNVDLWRFLTPQDLSLAIVESLRISKRLLLVASADLRCNDGALRIVDLDYFAEAYGSPNRIFNIKTVPGGAVIYVSAA